MFLVPGEVAGMASEEELGAGRRDAGHPRPDHAGELQLERACALDAIRPVDDPDLRRRSAHGVTLPRGAGPSGTGRRGQNSDTAIPAMIATAPASWVASSRSPLT